MTKSDLKKIVQYWKTGSDLDFDSAKAIAEKAKKNVQACFFLHLSIEKILKAYIVFTTDDHAPYIHNLPVLAKKANLVLNEDQRELLVIVNDFNMRCRYPDDKYSIYKKVTAAVTRKLLKRVGEFNQWISEKLKK